MMDDVWKQRDTLVEIGKAILKGYGEAPGEMWIPDLIGNDVERLRQYIEQIEREKEIESRHVDLDAHVSELNLTSRIRNALIAAYGRYEPKPQGQAPPYRRFSEVCYTDLTIKILAHDYTRCPEGFLWYKNFGRKSLDHLEDELHRVGAI